MPNGFVPSWIQPANEVANLAHGYQIGLSIGAQQAERTFREQQMMRQQQLAAQERAQWEAEFGLRAKQAADKAAAIKAYQSDIAGGMDPIQAIMKHGPSMQEPGAVQAAALRAPMLQEQQQAMLAFRQQQQADLQEQRAKVNAITVQRDQDRFLHQIEMENLRRELAKDPNKPKEEFVKTDTGQNAVVVRDAQGNPIGIRPLPTEKTPEEIAAEKAAQLEANKPSWLSRLFTKPTAPIVTPPGFGGATPSAEPATPAPAPRQGVRVLSITRRPDAASAPVAKPPITVNDIAPVPQDPVAVEQQRRVQLAQAVNLANEREKKQLEDARKRNEDVSGIVGEIFRRVMGERGTYDMLLDRPPER